MGPLVVCYGAGVDSTAMLVLLKRQNRRPDLIIFSDTGAEKPETYAYLDIIDEWLGRVGFPKVTRVKYRTTKAPYSNLEGNCTANETLPSLAYGRHSCSLKWKVTAIDYFIKGCSRGVNKCAPWTPAARAFKDGRKPTKLLGYDSGPADSRRSGRAKKEDADFLYQFPLQEEEWVRGDCIKQIAEEGLPIPIKSACFFCPASKKWEIYWLAAEHPDLFYRAISMEQTALKGKHATEESTVKGLGRRFGWGEAAEAAGIYKNGKISMSKHDILKMVKDQKPEYEANLIFKTGAKV
jgi:hypothetical protein